MPRALVALVATAATVLLVTSFRTAPRRLVLSPSAAASAGAPVRGPATSPRRQTPPASAPPPTPAGGAAPARTVRGAPVQDPYGTVQVAVIVRGGRILDVRTVSIPLDSGTSYSINSQAGPLLRSEALQAQSARIDVVSGATYTSQAYAGSLQSALDRVRRG